MLDDVPYACYQAFETQKVSKKSDMSEASGVPEVCYFWPRLPALDPDKGFRCMRRTPSREWSHALQYEHNALVAAWCGCARCMHVLASYNLEGF